MNCIISHRGNTSGPNTAAYGENHPSSIKAALFDGYHVEVDVRFIDNKFYLGHDKPEYEVGSTFFYNDRLWVHCKNIEALYQLYSAPLINAFFHDQDDCALTSQFYLWTFPKNILITDRSIAVMPELVEDWDISNAYGVCTDYPGKYK